MSPLNPFTVPIAHVRSLSDPRNGKEAKPDWTTRIVLLVLLVGSIVGCYLLDINLKPVAEALLAGYALVAGVLIAVFAQFAAWRTRLDDRAAFRPQSEASGRRLLDAATAHALVGVLASVLGVAFATLVALNAPWARLWGALALGFGVYLLALILIIVNTAFQAYNSNIDEGVREADDELRRPPPPTLHGQGSVVRSAPQPSAPAKRH